MQYGRFIDTLHKLLNNYHHFHFYSLDRTVCFMRDKLVGGKYVTNPGQTGQRHADLLACLNRFRFAL